MGRRQDPYSSARDPRIAEIVPGTPPLALLPDFGAAPRARPGNLHSAFARHIVIPADLLSAPISIDVNCDELSVETDFPVQFVFDDVHVYTGPDQTAPAVAIGGRSPFAPPIAFEYPHAVRRMTVIGGPGLESGSQDYWGACHVYVAGGGVRATRASCRSVPFVMHTIDEIASDGSSLFTWTPTLTVHDGAAGDGRTWWPGEVEIVGIAARTDNDNAIDRVRIGVQGSAVRWIWIGGPTRGAVYNGAALATDRIDRFVHAFPVPLRVTPWRGVPTLRIEIETDTPSVFLDAALSCRFVG